MPELRTIILLATLLLSVCAAIFFLYWKKNTPTTNTPTSQDSGQSDANPAFDSTMSRCKQIQSEYWTFSSDEFAALMRRELTDLSWRECLRLTHLISLRSISDPNERDAFVNPDFDEDDDREFSNKEKLQDLVARLHAKDSPFRPRHAEIKKRRPNDIHDMESLFQRAPDLQARLCNASYSHLGALEVIFLDENNEPTELGFIPFDEIRGFVIAAPSMFAPARISFEYEREDIVVRLPAIYGVSWSSPNDIDQDGSFTRFINHISVPSVSRMTQLGVGVQDFELQTDETLSLVGLTSIAAVEFALVIGEPGFDAKCKARGLDPNEIRNQIEKHEQ